MNKNYALAISVERKKQEYRFPFAFLFFRALQLCGILLIVTLFV